MRPASSACPCGPGGTAGLGNESASFAPWAVAGTLGDELASARRRPMTVTARGRHGGLARLDSTLPTGLGVCNIFRNRLRSESPRGLPSLSTVAPPILSRLSRRHSQVQGLSGGFHPQHRDGPRVGGAGREVPDLNPH